MALRIRDVRANIGTVRTLVGLVVFVGGSSLFVARPRWYRWFFPVMWALAAGVFVYVTLVEDRPLGSIGLAWPDASDLRRGLVAFVAGYTLFQALRLAVDRLAWPRDRPGPLQQDPRPSGWKALALAVTAGVTEEVVFRGYAVQRLGEEIGSFGVAAVISAVVFALCHAPVHGPRHAIGTLGPGLALGWLFVVTGNLVVCIVVHVCTDLYAFFVLPRVLAKRAAHRQPR